MTEQRRAREAAGRKAEGFAANWLRLRGYKILEQRFKTPDGEIDIIARKGDVLACIEVKQRSDARAASEAVTASSERRIMDAAETYVTRHPELLEQDFELRFDILYVIGRFRVDFIPDAFRAYD